MRFAQRGPAILVETTTSDMNQHLGMAALGAVIGGLSLLLGGGLFWLCDLLGEWSLALFALPGIYCHLAAAGYLSLGMLGALQWVTRYRPAVVLDPAVRKITRTVSCFGVACYRQTWTFDDVGCRLQHVDARPGCCEQARQDHLPHCEWSVGLVDRRGREVLPPHATFEVPSDERRAWGERILVMLER